MTERTHINITDLRALGHCAKGIRRWCIDNGVDFKDLRGEGIPVEHWAKIKDGMAVSALKRLQEQDKK